MTSPQISICIPTYNRAAMLAEALEAVIEQVRLAGYDQVEVILSDNCSTDRTPDIVTQIREAHPALRLTYFRQPENKGAPANVMHVLSLATGNYVYLLSDDDILLPGAVAKLLDLIQQYPTAGVYSLNTRSFVTDPNEETKPAFQLSQDRLIWDRDDCLRFLGTWITFLSAFAFRRDLMADRDTTTHVSADFPHSFLYLDMLAAAPGMVVTSRPFLAVRGDNTGGFNFFDVFVTRFAALMHYAERLGFSRQTTRAVLSRHLRSFLAQFIGMFRVRDSYGTFEPDFRDAAKRLWAVYGPNPFLLFVLLPALFAPRGLLRALHRLLKLARKFRKRRLPTPEALSAQAER